MDIDSSNLRLLWTVIQDLPSRDLLTLSEPALAALLLQQVSRRVRLNGEEVNQMYGYVSSKVSLIRDVADSRHSEGRLQASLYQ